MLWEFIIAGFTLGAIGSMHCVGMCGPLAMALPVQNFSKQKKLSAISLYQLGRIFTYSILGLIFGIAGRHIYLAGYQQWFSIIMGAVVVILVVQYLIFKKSAQPAFLNRFYSRVQKAIIYFLRSNKIRNYFLLGTANGLLPCGMVYVAIAGALTFTNVLHSTLFMVGFGAGTLPAMMAISYFGQFIKLSVRNQFRKALPVFATIIGILLILRGLNLGIPFISPVLPGAHNGAISCH
ncbi:MAG TPA: sulfite exporter TauE/SafE family protein [Chitinophagaceae bacterium]|nr:sulfite exporter TauE/SafE family protein [Chitinophagaceae bacterium]